MVSLSGYQTLHLIYESSNSEVYRAIRQPDHQPVILKVLKQNYPTPAELTRYKQEYQLTQSLNLEGIITAYDLQPYQNTLVIVLEDFGGESLKKLAINRVWSLTEMLSVLIKIADSLGQLHSAHIIHKDINPANIVLNPQTGKLKIIDLGISTRLTKENPTLKNPKGLEGTLAYISPEQTGRMNRSLDYRTDFYSLGVTFYELLTHQLPFQTDDELELVHCHIAKKPRSLSEINPEIPRMVSEIVSKLMAKNAEDRYESAWGLKTDLENCLNQIRMSGEITPFVLGKNDISDKFKIPQKLYGRSREIAQLIAAFERVRNQSEIMLIAGYSGIGKSALVQEIYKPITEKRGYFIAGKFDQFQRNIPYSAIVAAFKGLIRQLLTETTENLAKWQAKFLTALGTNGKVISDVIPEIELIIGTQPPVDELGPTEAQNRFNLVFQNFIRTCCTPDHPLVIFLDDLQWTDGATLKLIELMMTDRNLNHLFLIGAYRDNEVNIHHPLMSLVSELKKAEVIINEVTLTNLGLDDITHLIEDTVKKCAGEVKPLAELILSKTEGNPFFVNQFLINLYTDNLIVFDYDRQGWQWDLEQIKAQNITDNVVELMIGKLRKLAIASQEILKLAACIGANFNLSTLSIVAEQPTTEVFDQLIPVVQSGLILSLSELDQDLLIQDYKFLHDRVQQGAYALIPETDKQEIHLKIGQLLLQKSTETEREEKIFDIVAHLNLGFGKITEEREKWEVIELNLKAAQKAKLATAYKGALEYLKAGIAPLDQQAWSDHYQTTYALYKERCEVEYLTGNFDESQKWAEWTLGNTQSVLEKCEIYRILILQNTMLARYEQGFIAGKTALALLGVNLPDHKSDLETLKNALEIEREEIRRNLGDRSIISFQNLPETEEPEKKMAIKLLSHIAPTMFFSNQNVWYVIVSKCVNLSLQYGLAIESSFGFGTYAMFLAAVLEEYALSYEFADLSVKVSQRFNHLGFKCQALHLFATYVNGWAKHFKYADPVNEEAFSAGLESGEIPYAGYTVMTSAFNLFFQGKPLEQIEETLQKYLSFTQERSNRVATDLLWGCHLVTQNLRGITSEITSFDDPQQPEATYIQNCRDYQSYMGLCYYYIVKPQALYYYQKPAEALSYLLESQKLLPFISSSIGVSQHNFYYSLTLLALYAEADCTTQATYLKQIQDNQLRMKKWADNCPENYRHKYLLIAAELARNLGNTLEAMHLYDQAIDFAKDNDFIHEEALGNELAARFYLSLNKIKIARTYLQEARYGYGCWGANAKVKMMEQEYRDFLNLSLSESSSNPRIITRISSGEHKSSSPLDIETLIKSNQAISGEIVLEKLLVSLMTIILQNAGAQTGYLLLSDQNQMTIEASKISDTEAITVLQSIPLEQYELIPKTLINYVVRTQESIVLNDASNSGNFISDSYIRTAQPKSILCVPLINQGELVSIVYLENNLTLGAFTADRVQMIQLLSGQAAIALENAYLYQTLEQKVQRRTAELALANQEIVILNEKLKAENIRLSSELDVAKKIQHMVLPKPQELQDITHLDIAGYMEPADEVGGDYYDILPQGDQLKIAIGDVTGHGLESGVLMLMAQTAIRTLQKVNETDPIKFLDLLNQTLYDNLQRMNCDKNMTLFVVDYEQGRLKVSGQHESLLVVRANGEIEWIDTMDLGFPIGLDAKIADFISQTSIPLDSQDIAILYTDGIPEAANLHKEQYGLDRLAEIVIAYRDQSAQEIRDRVIEDVRTFIGEQKVFDDITLVVLKQQ